MADTSYARKPRIEKLGVRPGTVVLLVSVTDAHFISELQAAGARITRTAAPDLIFCAVDTRASLATLADLAKRMKPAGALWTIRPKGAALSEADVLTAGQAAGLVDVKVVRFSDTHTANKFVVRKTQRT